MFAFSRGYRYPGPLTVPPELLVFSVDTATLDSLPDPLQTKVSSCLLFSLTGYVTLRFALPIATFDTNGTFDGLWDVHDACFRNYFRGCNQNENHFTFGF
ncbi:hypothetical protein KQX54_007204 [Cotesia glomerata]|uniref:Uncharacterized protein n=1 Tax=Cotesia glomerata TaxID=32391 RepID=A0AAV7J3B3_COTGL|nr:hypothetical protein KQX54_007204 [Cotesia glomerata]